ncbi:MAG TPA: hypothetical protein PKE06_17715 [Flavilitoribacter sp.]|nr:hypothetical protein [Flavilitoribacter sp.]HMQ89477.1 hypothetical protein [Flavilitoribacter sp.]
MIWFLSILAGLLFLIIVLLWLPLQVEIATDKEIYEAKWSGLFRFRAVPADEKWRWFIRILFWETELGRGQTRVKTKPEPQKTKKKKKGSFSIQQGLRLAKGMLASIRVKRFRIDWDSDDFLVNAWLYPLFYLISRGKYRIHINFLGRQEASILLQARPLLLGWAFLRSFFHTKRNKP